jgi:transmembrane sensor
MVNQSSRRKRAEAEAAAWVARLQSTPRDLATEAALKAWLNGDATRRDAFERATEVWAIIPGAAAVDLRDTTHEPSPAHIGRMVTHLLALAASLLLVFGGPAWWMTHRPLTYATRLGEQEVATLNDGSRIALNTDTRVEVNYRPDIRQITLEQGEAMFDVAHNTQRPFIVAAGDKRVRAVGTSFIVRRIGGDIEVTLLKGKVAVTDAKPSRARTAPEPTILTPGERLIADKDAPVAIDMPPIDNVTAWRRGQIVFDATPLSKAVAELARYGGPQINVPDPRLASMPVSGVFSTNDTAEFAAAIAKLNGWRVVASGGNLTIEQ